MWGVVAMWSLPSGAQEMTAEVIKAATVLDVPFVLGEVDTREGAATLWTKGDAPANALLARFPVLPVQIATIEGQPSMLWRGFAGGGVGVLRADELDLDGARRYFCGSVADFPSASCFIDEDGDGRFDSVADAVPEGGMKPYHFTIVKGARPLDKALPYHIVAADQRPSVAIELRNCAKDYDRPRFTALSTADRNVPAVRAAFAWHAKDSSFAHCRRGKQIGSVEGSSAVAPDGGYIGQIGPLAFTVGPKNNPQLAFIGPVDSQALYRLEGARLVDMRIGRTPNQAQLAAMKEYPYPTMMADDGAVIHDGAVAVGGTLATIPFHHAYRGKLTQDIVISTLLGKRSLAAGTVVYGFPGQNRLTRTVNGIPDMQSVGDEEYRKINLDLTWCAPVKGAQPEAEKPGSIGKGGWSAACIPHGSLGNHTIIGDMQPAFGVESVSYRATTSSNDGAPPILRDDSAAFDQQLRMEYVFQGREGDFAILSKRVYFGDQLTSSEPVRLYAPSGQVAVEIAGASVDLSLQSSGELSVRSSRAPVVGNNPVLRWDQRAFMLQQLKRMGLNTADPEGESSPAPQ